MNKNVHKTVVIFTACSFVIISRPIEGEIILVTRFWVMRSI